MAAFDPGKIFSVPNLVAVVTGGGSGIGLLMTKALALNGAQKVYIIGRRKEVLEAAAKESPHGNITPIIGDVTSKDSLKAAVDQIQAEMGYINLLIANSGVSGPRTKKIAEIKSLEELQDEMWKMDVAEFTETFNVNCSAVFFSTIAFLGLLNAGNKQGNVEQFSQVVATSSIASFNRIPTGGYSYGMSKAACTHFMKQLASTLAPYDIRSNVLAPGRKDHSMSSHSHLLTFDSLSI